jgi:hypothetical protein
MAWFRQLCARTRIVIIAKANEWAKAEISAVGKQRSRTSPREQKSPVHIPRPKRYSVAAIRLLLKNQMPLSLLP